MSEFPGRPPVERGSLLVYETQNSTRPDQEIVFQYNPETLRRAFATRATPASPSRTGAAREAVLQVPGPPVETITATVVLDAADQVDDPAGAPATTACTRCSRDSSCCSTRPPLTPRTSSARRSAVACR